MAENNEITWKKIIDDDKNQVIWALFGIALLSYLFPPPPEQLDLLKMVVPGLLGLALGKKLGNGTGA